MISYVRSTQLKHDKENPDGSIRKFRARWCAKGYTQKKGRDYTKTMAPVVRSDTTRILLAIASVKKWMIRQFDLETAFLNSIMDRLLYVEQPTGFEDGDLVCKLNKALYGLVQSAHLWFEDVKSTLLSMGFVQSKHDDALFFNTERETYITVDDIKVFAPTHALIDEVKEKLFAKYQMTDEGDVKWYLGMEINRVPDEDLLLTQTKYIQDLLARHGMKDCSKVLTPMTGNKMRRAPNGYTAPPDELNSYQTLLGEVMHLMVQTRPDLAQGVSCLA